MGKQDTFKRYELKYLKIVPDAFPTSSIRNIYFDTPDKLLIRRSMDKPLYKEKIRLRSYGTSDDASEVFVELKKKYNDVVYKRRVSMNYKEAKEYLTGEGRLIDKRRDELKFQEWQILNEIDYVQDCYKRLEPAVFLSYERESFKAAEGLELRVTFDRAIMWRDYDVDLAKEPYGKRIIDEDMVLMELKTPYAIPLWLARLMSEQKIYKTTFSKYGRAYVQQSRKIG
jgi:SPX domain protein involved in polyphosphate accumulation